jgi:glucose/arabinose dehydrogenase
MSMAGAVRSALVAATVAVATMTGATRGDINFPTFPGGAGLTLVSDASVTGNVLRLTPSDNDQVGAAWFTTPQTVGAGFSTTFTFRISAQDAGGADGFAFVIQNSAVNAIGEGGCQIGYDPIPNSVAVEFDTYQSTACGAGAVNDVNDNHISIHTRGVQPNSAQESASIGAATTLPDMSDGAVHTVKIDYFPGEMDVYLDDMTTPRITAGIVLDGMLSLNTGKAWVGFTAATGGAAERHDIRSWTFTEGAPPGSGHPRTPVMTQPATDGVIVNPQDVHMETSAFFDADGDAHLCTDWQLLAVDWGVPGEVIWNADCITGVERVHLHLGDGAFIGSYTGRRDLLPNTDYQLRARHRDNSGDPATEWSLWGTRMFHTAALGTDLPLLVEDVIQGATWSMEDGTPVMLPAVGSGTPAVAALEGGMGGLLVSFAGTNGVSNMVTNPGPLEAHVQVRVRLDAGSGELTLPRTIIRFVDEDCVAHQIYLPAVSLAAGGEALYWASITGSTFVATAAQDHADMTTLARGSEMPYLPTQPGYVVERFATGLQFPVNIAFVPHPGPNPADLLCYVTELYGTIKAVTRDGHLSDYRTGLLNYVPSGAFPGSGEQGLAGIVVDPTNGDVYCGALIEDGTGDRWPRVLRLQSTDGGWTASSLTVVLAMPGETQGQSHMISNFSFGPDGYLYVHNGDGFVTATGQDLSSFRGKILRMTRNGDPVPTNPFYNASDGITSRDYVVAYGLRNPFGGAWRQSDGNHITVENGPSVDRISKLVMGRNYLYDDTDASMTNFALYNWSPSVGPVNITFIQAGVFGGSGFPADKFDHAFVTESGPTWATGTQMWGKRIVEFVIDNTGTLVSGPTSLVEYAGSGKGSAVGLEAGPDGLYFTGMYKDLDYDLPTDPGAEIWRIRYAPSRPCCTADFNNDGDIGTDADIEAFFACLAGSCCPTCGSADYNGDGDVGTDSDIEAFFRVLAGGSC